MLDQSPGRHRHVSQQSIHVGDLGRLIDQINVLITLYPVRPGLMIIHPVALCVKSQLNVPSNGDMNFAKEKKGEG